MSAAVSLIHSGKKARQRIGRSFDPMFPNRKPQSYFKRFWIPELSRLLSAILGDCRRDNTGPQPNIIHNSRSTHGYFVMYDEPAVIQWVIDNGWTLQDEEAPPKQVHQPDVDRESLILQGKYAKISEEIKRLRQENSLLKAERESKHYATSARTLRSQINLLSVSTDQIMRCGIYFLIQNAEIIYVGQSTNVLARISSHSQIGRKFDRVAIIDCPRRELDDREGYYIRLLSPRENKSSGPTSSMFEKAWGVRAA